MTTDDRDLPAVARRATNVSLDPGLVAEARALGINISRACESGLVDRIADERGRRWCIDNAAALEASNAHVEAKGVPLTRLRRF